MKKSVTKAAKTVSTTGVRRRPGRRGGLKAGQTKSGRLNGARAEWIEKCAADPEEIREFCARHRLVDAASATLKLAKEIYKPLAVRASIMADPEGSSEWLIFEVDIRSEVDAALRANDRFTEQWLDLLPIPKRMLLRVLYNFV